METISLLLTAISLLAIAAVGALLWFDERRAKRKTAAMCARLDAALKAANTEVQSRPRVRAVSTPLPTLERNQR